MFDLFENSGGGFEELLSSATPDLPDVESVLTDLIQKEPDEYGGLKMRGFHASAVATRSCPNFYALHMLYPFEQDFTPTQRMIFSNGHGVHDRLQRVMRPVLFGSWKCGRCGVYHEMNKDYFEWLDQERGSSEEAQKEYESIATFSEVPKKAPSECAVCGYQDFRYAEWRVVSHEYGFASKMDGVFMNGAGKFVGWEIKSANVRSFNLVLQGGASRKYKHQFGLYMALENKRLGDGHFEAGVMTFECKNDQTRKHIPIFLNEIDVTPELNAAKEALRMIRDEKVFSKGKLCGECNGCEYNGKRCKPK